MNNDFIAHIIRDVFPERAYTVIYGEDQGLRLTLLDPQHSVGALQMHTERHKLEDTFEFRFWEPIITDPFMAYGDVDLFISINYDPIIYSSDTKYMAIQIKKLLKHGGKAFVVNPGLWAQYLKNTMSIDGISTKEIKRYSIMKDQDVFVYENI